MRTNTILIAAALSLFMIPACDMVPEDAEEGLAVEQMILHVSEDGEMPATGYEIVRTLTAQLSVEFFPETALDTDYIWITSDPDIVSVSETGLMTALAEGEAIVGAELVNGRKRAVANVLVTPYVAENPIKSITLSETQHDFTDISDAPVTLAATLEATDPDVPVTIETVKWSSSDLFVVQVSDAGEVRIIGGGEATVRCEAIDGGGAFAECRFTVPGNEIKDALYDMTGPQFDDGYYKKTYGQIEIEVPVLDRTGARTGATEIQTWLDRNLGAERRATESAPGMNDAYKDSLSFGSLFQWSRKADGHEKVKWSEILGENGRGYTLTDYVTVKAADRRDAGHSSFISVSYDWAENTKESFWGGSQYTIASTGTATEEQFTNMSHAAPLDDPAQANNPCPYGYRVPTIVEFHQLVAAVAGLDKLVYNTNGNSMANATETMANNPPYIPFSGNRANTAAGYETLSNLGGWIMLWTNSAQSDNNGWPMRIQNTGNNFRIAGQHKANGYPVRCIKD